MLRRIVASRHEPYTSCNESDDRAHPKGRAPSMVNHEVGDQRRCEPRSGAYAGENPAVRNAAFAYRDPAGDELICCGIDYCLSGAEEESHGHEQEDRTTDACRNKSGQCREEPPPENTSR